MDGSTCCDRPRGDSPSPLQYSHQRQQLPSTTNRNQSGKEGGEGRPVGQGALTRLRTVVCWAQRPMGRGRERQWFHPTDLGGGSADDARSSWKYMKHCYGHFFCF